MRCTKRLTGRKGECRTPLEEVISSLGKISWVCPRCSWVEKGLCWECGKAKEKKKLYCLLCAIKSRKASVKKHNASDEYKQKKSLYFKNRWDKDPEFKKRKSKIKKEWLEKNPQKKEEYKLSRIYKELGL